MATHLTRRAALTSAAATLILLPRRRAFAELPPLDPPRGAELLVPSTRLADVRVAAGWEVHPVLAYGTPVGGGARMGCDPDFLALLPDGPDRALLWVNNEFPPGKLSDPGWRGLDGPPTRADALESMGATVVALRRTETGWQALLDDPANWRITPSGPSGTVTGPARDRVGKTVAGTIANCGGGVTPWGTVLTCEENFRYDVPDVRGVHDGHLPAEWPLDAPMEDFRAEGVPGEAYGWVVEVDPRTRGFVRRHTALGRMRHEGVACVAVPGERLRLYMAEDRDQGGLWRFTSRKPWSAGLSREAASALLHTGSLEVAELRPDGTLAWIPVGLASPIRRKEACAAHLAALPHARPEFAARLAAAATLGDLYLDEASLLVDASAAGLLAGGTGLGRPEGCVRLGSDVAFAVTKAVKRPAGGLPAELEPPFDDRAGAIVRLVDPDGPAPRWGLEATGGDGWRQPDNLGLDADGVVLVATDADTRPGEAEDAVRNHLVRLDAAGPTFLLEGPPGAEICGPILTPDGSILCTLQHPAAAWGPGMVVELRRTGA